MTSSRRVPTSADIFRAALTRLAAHRDRLQRDLAAVTNWLETIPPGHAIAEDDPASQELMEQIRAPGDRRCQWGRLVALLALVYMQRKDMAACALVGHELLTLERQSQRRKARRSQGDALNNLIAAHLVEQPGRPTALIIQDLASAILTNPAIADYEPDSGTLTYQPSPTAERMRDVGRAALERRVQRFRRSIVTQPGGA